MASILSVGEIRGLQENSNTVTLPAGHTLDVTNGTVNGIDSFAYPDNLPAGAVVQTQVLNSQTVTTNNSSSMVELHSDYRASITPTYSNSIISIHTHIAFNPNGVATNTLFGSTIKRSTDGGSSFGLLSGDGTASGSRIRMNGMWGRRNNGFDGNDMNYFDWICTDQPGTTGTVIYTPFFKQETSGTGTVYIGYSNGDTGNWGFHIPIVITLTEIKQ